MINKKNILENTQRTDTQLVNKVMKIIKRNYTKKNDILKINFSGNSYDGVVKVTMPSTCELGENMTWDFLYTVEESNVSEFSEMDKVNFPELITPEIIEVTPL